MIRRDFIKTAAAACLAPMEESTPSGPAKYTFKTFRSNAVLLPSDSLRVVLARLDFSVEAGSRRP